MRRPACKHDAHDAALFCEARTALLKRLYASRAAELRSPATSRKEGA